MGFGMILQRSQFLRHEHDGPEEDISSSRSFPPPKTHNKLPQTVFPPVIRPKTPPLLGIDSLDPLLYPFGIVVHTMCDTVPWTIWRSCRVERCRTSLGITSLPHKTPILIQRCQKPRGRSQLLLLGIDPLDPLLYPFGIVVDIIPDDVRHGSLDDLEDGLLDLYERRLFGGTSASHSSHGWRLVFHSLYVGGWCSQRDVAMCFEDWEELLLDVAMLLVCGKDWEELISS